MKYNKRTLFAVRQRGSILFILKLNVQFRSPVPATHRCASELRLYGLLHDGNSGSLGSLHGFQALCQFLLERSDISTNESLRICRISILYVLRRIDCQI